MKAMPDLSRICKKFRKGSGTLEDVVRAYQVVLKVNTCWCITLVVGSDCRSASRLEGKLGTTAKQHR